jgi:type II secretory pathway pseudopilin PulG
MKHKNFKNKKGFSLIEVFASLMILSFGIAAVIVLMMQSIRSSQTARDQIIASMLAQEGIELVRNLKDNGDLDGTFSEASDCNGNKCEDLRVDETMSFFDKNNGLHPSRLHLKGNFFVHDDAGAVVDTKFFRRIDLQVNGNILPAPSDREITATSYVTWNDSGFAAISPWPAACNVGNMCLSVVSVMPDIN